MERALFRLSIPTRSSCNTSFYSPVGLRFGVCTLKMSPLLSFTRSIQPTTLMSPRFDSFNNWSQNRFFAKTAEKKSKDDQKKAAAPKRKKKEKDAKQLKKEAEKKEEERKRAEAKRQIVSVNTVSAAPKSTSEMFSQTIKELEEQAKTVETKKQVGIKNQRKSKGWRVRGPKEATAVGKTLKSSVKKLNLLAGLIRGLTYKEASIQLKLSQKRISKAVLRLLESCRFNAENIHNLNPERLIISEIWTGRGIYLKRIRHHSRGRAGRVLKPRTNLHLVMKELPEGDNRLLSKAQQREIKFLERLEKLDKSLKPSVMVTAQPVQQQEAAH